MKSKFFKILAATAIVSATMAISSVAAMASTYKLDMADFFTADDISAMDTSAGGTGYVNTQTLTKECTVDASDDSTTMTFNSTASSSTNASDAFSLISYLEESYSKTLSGNDEAGYTIGFSTNGVTDANGKRQIQFTVPSGLNAKVTVDYFRRGNSRTVGIYASGSTTATASFGDSSSSWTLKSETLSGIEGGDDGATYGLSVNGGGLYICGITVETYDASSVSTYSVSGTVTLDGAAAEGMTVSYGTNTYVTGSDGAFEFTDIEAGTDVTCSVAGTDSYTGGSVTVESISEDTTGLVIALTSKTARQVITDKATFTIADDFIGSSTSSTENFVINDYFTILSNVQTDNGKTVSGITFDGRLKFVGAPATDSNGIPTTRAIVFETSGAATVQVCAVTGKNGEARKYYIMDSSGNKITTITTDSSNDNPTFTDLISLPAADTYYIACEENLGIYSVNVVVGGSLTTNSYGAVYADQADSYVIAGVTAADLEASALTINTTGTGSAEIDSTDTVYENVYVDNNLIAASDVGSFDYIYAVKIEGSNGNSTDFTATAE